MLRTRCTVRVPAWCFYLADGVLVLFAVGMILLGPVPPDSWRLTTAAGAVVLGATLALVPMLARAASSARADRIDSAGPRWILGHAPGASAPAPTFAVHLGRPLFLGRLAEVAGGKTKVIPLWIEDAPNAAADQLEELTREATVIAGVLTTAAPPQGSTPPSPSAPSAPSP
jgi:hypothetical protein